MKTRYLPVFALTAVLNSTTPALAQNSAAACLTIFHQAQSKVPVELWRANITNALNSLSGINSVATSTDRETWLEASKTAMLKFLFNEVDTPEMVFAAAEGVVSQAPTVALTNSLKNTIPLNFTTDPKNQGYHYDRIPRIAVSGLGSAGILGGTLLLPVSGHTGLADAKAWSKSDTYSIFCEDPKGVRQVIAKDQKSLDYVTAQELAVRLRLNEVYRLLYYRSGSGGPEGYSDGRILEIVWDGK